MNWLDSLDLENEVALSMCSTITPPPRAEPNYRECHEFVDMLFDRHEPTRAWTLHYFLIKVLFCPSAPEDPEADLSHVKMIQARCNTFMAGDWKTLWIKALRAPPMGTHGKHVEAHAEAHPNLTDAELEEFKRIRRARTLASQGDLSRAVKHFDAGGVLDPTIPSTKQKLHDLNNPPTPREPIPDAPEGFCTRAYNYDLDEKIWVDTLHSRVEIPFMQFVLEELPDHRAQSLSGARYEHYKCLPASTVEKMVHHVLNAMNWDSVREVHVGGRLIALDKKPGVRPIVIGECIRRIAARVVCLQDKELFAKLFTKVCQYGVSTKGGIDYAHHKIRLHLMRKFDEHMEAPSDDRDTGAMPAMAAMDFSNAFNAASRAKMIAQVQSKHPRLSRFTRYCYSKPSKLKVLHQGRVAYVISSQVGSHQGDPLGGHYYSLSDYEFMEGLLDIDSNLAISWIVDDLTVSGTFASLHKVAQYIELRGAPFGLFPNRTKSHFYSPIHAASPTYNPDCGPERHPRRKLTDMGIRLSPNGIDKLRGAPIGTPDHEQERATAITTELMQPVAHLHKLRDPQLEYCILRYCVATRPLHLARALPPDRLTGAHTVWEAAVKPELERILSVPTDKVQLADPDWRLAKLPVKHGGSGIGNFPLVSVAAYLATLGHVLRHARKEATDLQHAASTVVASAITTRNTDLNALLAHTAEAVDGQASSNPILPTIDTFAEMPPTKRIAAKLYSNEFKLLLADPELSPAKRAWHLSCAQFNAGAWLNAIPSIKIFKATANVFRSMLQIRMGLNLSHSNSMAKCPCGEGPNILTRKGWHFMHMCKHSKAMVGPHDAIRNAIGAMYRELKVPAALEQGGLYGTWDPQNQYLRPADVLVYAHESLDDLHPGKDVALDVTIADPVNPRHISNLRTASVPLAAAKAAHQEKLKKFRTASNRQPVVDFAFQPLAFELTGAMGTETQTWWRKLQKWQFEDTNEHGGATHSRRPNRLDRTWAANNFATFHRQRISFAFARRQAQLAQEAVGRLLPRRGHGALL
jgi:hypothetical protein